MDMSFTLRPENRDLLERVSTMIRDEIMPLEDSRSLFLGIFMGFSRDRKIRI